MRKPCDECKRMHPDGECTRMSRRADPCRVCDRVHPGRCLPAVEHSDPVTFTLPRRLAERLRDEVPWGERSRWVAALIERELSS